MKAFTFLFVMLTSVNISLSQVDWVLHENWNGFDWENAQIEDYDYDGNGYLINMLSLNWFSFNNDWTEDYQIIYSNDLNGNELFNVYQIWNGVSWDDYQKKTKSYDVNYNVIEELVENWNGSSWENFVRKTYSYDSNNYLITAVFENWNSGWELSTKEDYINNIDGTPQQVTLQFWSGSIWEDWARKTFTYNSNSSVLTEVDEIWNGSLWEYWEASEFIYDGNNYLVFQVDYTWLNGWVETSQIMFTNDGNGLVQFHVEQALNGTTWENVERVTYTYIPTASLLESNQEVKKELVKIVDFLGRETKPEKGTVNIHVYSDGTTDRVVELE